MRPHLPSRVLGSLTAPPLRVTFLPAIATLLLAGSLTLAFPASPDLGDRTTRDQALSDGRVTSSELSALAREYVDCLERLGLEGAVHFSAEGMHFSYHFSADQAVEPVLQSRDGRDCYRRTLSIAEYRWADDHAVVPSSMDGFYDAVSRCLGSEYSTAPVQSATKFDSLYLKSPAVAMACFDRAYEASYSYADSGAGMSEEPRG